MEFFLFASFPYTGTPFLSICQWVQRVFWAFTEGAVATALIVAGGTQALSSLQAASLLSGLPFTFMLGLMCISTYRMCIRAEINDKEDINVTLQEDYKNHKAFQMPIFGGLWNVFEHIVSLGRVHESRADLMPLPTGQEVMDFFVATVLPFIPLYKLYCQFSPKEADQNGNKIGAVLYGAGHILWVVLFACTGVSRGLRGFAWIVLLWNGCILSTLRSKFELRLCMLMMLRILVSLVLFLFFNSEFPCPLCHQWKHDCRLHALMFHVSSTHCSNVARIASQPRQE